MSGQREDPLAPAKGCARGLLLGAAVLIILGALNAWWVTRH